MSQPRMPSWNDLDLLAGESGPACYLQYLAASLCYGLWKTVTQEFRTLTASGHSFAKQPINLRHTGLGI